MKNSRPLVHQLVLRLVSVTAVVMFGSFLAFSFLRARSGYEALDIKLEWTIRQLGSALSVPLWNLDLESASLLLERTLEDGDLRYIRVDSADGLFSAMDLGEAAPPSPRLRPGLTRSGSVYYGNALLAHLTVRGTDERILREFAVDMAGFALMLLVLEIALSLSLYLLLWSVVLKPLFEVKSYALSILASEEGVSDHRGEVPNEAHAVRNELALLDGAVHGMVSRLEARLTELERSRGEKMVLIDELSHRVKNNLSIIYGLLDFQRSRFSDSGIEGMIGAMQARIHALSALHQHLLRTEDLRHIRLAAYLRDLVAGIRTAIGAPDKKGDIEVRQEIDDTVLDIDLAQACGLVVTELLSNALRHAFPEPRRGTVFLRVFRDEGMLRIQVGDDGVGLPAGDVQDGTGMLVIKGIVTQLRGRMVSGRREGRGTEFIVEIPV